MELIVIVVAISLVVFGLFGLGVYIIGTLVIWRFIIMGEVRPEGWGNLGTTDPYLHRNRWRSIRSS
jgi:hypothetical protein